MLPHVRCGFIFALEAFVMAESAKQIRIQYVCPEVERTKFANQCTVQLAPHGEVYLSFFEVVPPLIVEGDPDEMKRRLELIDNIQAVCIARIVVTKDRLGAIIGAMAEVLAQEANATNVAREASNVTIAEGDNHDS